MNRELEDAILQSRTLGDLRAVQQAIEAIRETENPAEAFANWVSKGPALAKAAGVYVGIKVYASKEDARRVGDI